MGLGRHQAFRRCSGVYGARNLTFLLQNHKQMWVPQGGVEQEPGKVLGTFFTHGI